MSRATGAHPCCSAADSPCVRPRRAARAPASRARARAPRARASPRRRARSWVRQRRRARARRGGSSSRCMAACSVSVDASGEPSSSADASACPARSSARTGSPPSARSTSRRGRVERSSAAHTPRRSPSPPSTCGATAASAWSSVAPPSTQAASRSSASGSAAGERRIRAGLPNQPAAAHARARPRRPLRIPRPRPSRRARCHVTAHAARKARHRSTRPRGRSAASATTAASPASAALSRCPARSRGSRAGPTRSSTAPTATIASPGAVVSSKRTAPASSSAATRQAGHRQERHDARGQSRLRGQRADLGIDAAALVETPRERSQQRGQVASRAQLQRDGRGRESRALAERCRERGRDVLAGRRAPARERERLARGTAGRACGDQSARPRVRPAPSSAATRRSASGSSRSSARSPRTLRKRRMQRGGHGLRTHAPLARQASAARLASRRRSRGQRPRRSAPRQTAAGRAATLGHDARRRDRDQPALAVAAADDLHDDVEGRSDLLAHGGVRQLEPAMSASSSMRLSASSGPFACTVVSDPSWPVVIACSMSSASPPRTSPTTSRSGRMRSALRTSSRMPTSPRALQARAARLEPRDVRAVDAQLGGILDRDDALARVDAGGQRPQQRRLAARRATADHDREARAHAAVRADRHRPRRASRARPARRA